MRVAKEISKYKIGSVGVQESDGTRVVPNRGSTGVRWGGGGTEPTGEFFCGKGNEDYELDTVLCT
jgi:hypothetical protein